MYCEREREGTRLKGPHTNWLSVDRVRMRREIRGTPEGEAGEGL